MSSQELLDEKKSIEKNRVFDEKVDVLGDEQEIDYYGQFEDRFISRLLYKTGHSADDSIHDLPKDTEFMLKKLAEMSQDEALVVLTEALEYHDDDPNFPSDDYEEMKKLVAEPNVDDPEWDFELRMLAALILHHSPYPEVRAVTDPFDDLNMPIETIRSYTIAFIWLIIGSGVNEFFSHRYPSISLSTSVAQMLLYPSGKLWEFIFPDWGFNFRGKRISMNPGPWNYKEQMFATILYSVTNINVYVSYNIVTQKMFYKNTWLTFGFEVLLTLSTQFMGFSFAGILRKFVIYPTKSMWPTVLPTLALNRALMKPEKKESIHGWTITKYKFFFVTFLGMFIYFWLPDYLFQALSYFNWMTWIAPNNFNLAVVTGGYFGLGFNPIPTFDWNNLAFTYPLTVPFFSTMNQFVGTVIGFFCVIGIYYSNYKWSAYMPPNDNGIYTNTGVSYEVTEVLTNGLLDEKKYKAYSPPFYTAANLLVYGSFFAIYPFSFLYTCYVERRSLWMGMKQATQIIKNWRRSNFHDFKDPHSRMMARYPEVPDWWFLVILVISIVLAILCVELYPTNTPVWGIFFTIGMNFVFLIPLTMLCASTGYSLGLNVLVELIVGYALPGNGVALMTLKALGYNIDGQASNYISDQKLAHYAKLPPRVIFRGQLMASFIQCFVFLGVVNWSISNIEDFCQEGQKQKFTCPNERTYYSASVFWGVIGPKRVFNELYPVMKYAFLIGFLLALLLIAIKKFYPRVLNNHFQPTIIIGGLLNYAPYNLMYVTPGFYISFAFMYYIRRHYLAWFEKYNYVLSSALDAGVAFSAIIIFFSVQYHPKNISWWGNNVPFEGVDGYLGRQSLKDVSELPNGFFGPATWS